jgi:hypothetical protein
MGGIIKMSKEKIKIKKEKLKELYIDKDWSQNKCADFFNCHSNTIRRRREKWNIKKEKEDKPKLTKEKLKELYIDKDWTKSKTADYFKCSESTISRRMNKWNLQKLELNIKINKEKLKELYIDKDWTQTKCADFFNCSLDVINRRLKEYNINIKSNMKTNEEFLEELNEKVGDHYIPQEKYKGSNTKIEFLHKECGKTFKMTPSCLFQGQRCTNKKCLNKRKSKSLTKTNEEFLEELNEKVGDHYIPQEKYKGAHTKIEFLHKECGKTFKMKPVYLLGGYGCSNCKGKKISQKLKKTNEEFLDDVYDEVGNEYTPLEEYKDAKTNIKMRHNSKSCNYNVWKIKPYNFFNGNRCPKCSFKDHESKTEKELLKFIKNNYDKKIISSDRQILNGKELDIYLPKDKIAFEFNGLYWHSETMGKGKKYHLNKTKKCSKQNIQLIHVFEDEWNNNKKLVKNKILHLLNLNDSPSIYARKCYIKEISAKIKGEFLDKYHIQGKDRSNIKLGLYSKNNNKLVAVMTFSKLRKALGQSHKKNHWELSRYATNYNYIVPGGFSKLFKYFIRNYDYKEIITYADRRWSNGNVYNKSNFKLDHISEPNYWYVKSGNIRKHRFNFRKGILEDKFPNIYDDEKTEKEIMEETKYNRIWDCGNYVFKFTGK